MLGKQVLTLACVGAILVTGACFLPQPRTPAPALPPQLSGAHRIAVLVEDAAAVDPIDREVMSRDTVSNFNQLWADYPVRAAVLLHDTTADATLRIVVLSKSVSMYGDAGSKQRWDVQFTIDATLIATDGRLIWKQEHQRLRFPRRSPTGSPAPAWNDPALRRDMAYRLAMQIGDSIFWLLTRNCKSHCFTRLSE
jgi:hypothetical protein